MGSQRSINHHQINIIIFSTNHFKVVILSMRLVMPIMKDNFCWLCERNTFPCAVFEDGSKYKVNALFEQLSSDANLHRQIVSLVKQSQNNLGIALNMPIDVCNTWQNLTALSLEQNGSVYTVVFIEPNPSLVKHATSFFASRLGFTNLDCGQRSTDIVLQ